MSSINDINETVLSEVLSYFTLNELNTNSNTNITATATSTNANENDNNNASTSTDTDTDTSNNTNTCIRATSKSFLEACEERKRIQFNYLSKPDSFVQIIGLTSAKGQLFNSKIGTTVAIATDSAASKKASSNSTSTSASTSSVATRFPIQLIHEITGKTQILQIKISNINIYPPKEKVQQFQNKLHTVQRYNTKNSTLRDYHGILLDNCLKLSRWYNNQLNGYAYHPNDYESFMNLRNTDVRYVKSSSTLFSFWDVKPNLIGRFSSDNATILDKVVMSLIQNEKQIMQSVKWESERQSFSKLESGWNKDGINKQLIIRNYTRFMSTWSKERVQGKFFVTNVYKTGTIMVKVKSDDDVDDQTPLLGNVYLVKGHSSVIGELFPPGSLPALAHATILPLYDFLVYDGIMMGVPQTRNRGQICALLKSHVQNALDKGTVITQGESSRKGLWDSIPPTLPTIVGDGESLDWTSCEVGDIADRDDCILKSARADDTIDKKAMQFTEKQKNTAMKIAKLTKKKGTKTIANTDVLNTIVFRRYGYTKEENPDRICILLYNQSPTNMFTFNNNELTYDLDEILHEILNHVKQFGMPSVIMPDELSVVQPLAKILTDSLDGVGVSGSDTLKVVWYPPPSEEESSRAMMGL